MADSKKIAKKVFRGIGKGCYYFGKGCYLMGRAIGRDIQKAHAESQERQRIEAEQRRYYRQIERESYHAVRGAARGVADVREQERIRRQDRVRAREIQDNLLGRNLSAPRFNDPLFPQNSKKRKKKRSIWDY